MKKIELKKCELCDKFFEININDKKSNAKRFCSGTCAKRFNGLNNKGKHRTEKWKELMKMI